MYSNIVKAVNEAEEAAKRAIQAAEESIKIVGSVTVIFIGTSKLLGTILILKLYRRSHKIKLG